MKSFFLISGITIILCGSVVSANFAQQTGQAQVADVIQPTSYRGGMVVPIIGLQINNEVFDMTLASGTSTGDETAQIYIENQAGELLYQASTYVPDTIALPFSLPSGEYTWRVEWAGHTETRRIVLQ